MNAFVEVESSVAPVLRVLSEERYLGPSLEPLVKEISEFAHAVRTRLGGHHLDQSDRFSTAAIDLFITDPFGKIVVDCGNFYFVAVRSSDGVPIRIVDIQINQSTSIH